MSDWLKDDYEAPKSGGNYTSFEDGENRIRVLSEPILGWEDWVDNKPVRTVFKGPDSAPPAHDPAKRKVKHFWGFVVYNYTHEKIEICVITQVTIRKAIETLAKNKQDWGDPRKFDIIITKSGSNMETEYQTMPASKKAVVKKVKDAYVAIGKIVLTNLFKNENPFVDEDSDDSSEAIEEVDSIADTGDDVLPGGDEAPAESGDEKMPWD